LSKSFIKIHPYCIGKVNQLRLDRFIERNQINLVYIHAEQTEEIENIKQLGIEVLTYTRSDFVDIYAPKWSYKTEYNYTLINELLNSEKQKYGKKTKYKMSMDKMITTEIFAVDEKKYESYCDTEEQAKIAYIIELKKMKDNKEKQLESYIKYTKKEIENLAVKINKLNKELN
jgi:hydroxymethylpyrimidine pyrophosphatase-like HAD family hydrolase